MAEETKNTDNKAEAASEAPVKQPERLPEKQPATDMTEEAKQAKVPAGDKMAPRGKRMGRGRRPAGDAGEKPGDDRKDGPRGRGGKPGRGRGGRPEEDREFDQQILELARVTRVTKGGKRMRFRVTMIIGDRKGRVGYGIAKGADVQTAVQKAVNQAKKRLIRVPVVSGTIPHPLNVKFSAAKVVLKPAPKGTGIKAGGAVRVVLEFAGVPNVTGKILGSGNKINNTKATIKALKLLTPLAKKGKGQETDDKEETSASKKSPAKAAA